MSLLASTDGVEFAFLQNHLALTSPDLSKQMTALADAGYVNVDKTGKGPGSTTWFRLTRAGRTAYRNHVAALRELIEEGVSG